MATFDRIEWSNPSGQPNVVSYYIADDRGQKVELTSHQFEQLLVWGRQQQPLLDQELRGSHGTKKEQHRQFCPYCGASSQRPITEQDQGFYTYVCSGAQQHTFFVDKKSE